MQKYLTLVFILLFTASLFAQHEPPQPFEEFGVKVKVLTLSNGKFCEFFTNDTVYRFGSVMFNHITGEVESVVFDDTLYGEYNLRPDVVSRWLSPDPLGAQFPNWSPYNFVLNNPIRMVDPTGMAPDDYVYLNTQGKEIGRIPDASVNKVTIIKDENLQKFDNLPYGRNSIAQANTMGNTYDLIGVLSLYKSSASDVAKVDPKTHMDASGNKIEDANGNAKQGIAMEHGASLKLQNGEVVAVGNVQGTPTNVSLDAASPYNDIVGTAHTHPNQGKGATTFNSTIVAPFNSTGPSSEYDLGGQGAPKQGYYNIVIDKTNVYFYNKYLQNNKVLTLPRTKL